LWRAFDYPQITPVIRAGLRMTADNSYTVYRDGREIGRRANANRLAEYELTWLMSPAHHGLGVEAFNDTLEAGMILSLRVKLADGKKRDVFPILVAHAQWRVSSSGGSVFSAPLDGFNPASRRRPQTSPHPA
jgi:hypothetical protein